MRRAGRLVRGFTGLFRKRRAERELDDELHAYLETAVEQKMAAGMDREEAGRAARLEIGSIEAIKDDVREVGWESSVETLLRDLRFALRTLAKSPGFTAVAVFTLAIGIGAAIVVFSVFSAVLWQPLPYPNAARLVRIVENVPAEESISGRTMRLSSMSPQEFDWWRRNSHTLANLAMSAPESRTMITREGTVLLAGQRVSPSLFAMRGLQPVLGRWLYPDEERADARVVVLNAATWQRYFGTAADVIDRSVALDGETYTVVGVMPATFGEQAFWMPFAVEPPRPGSRQLVEVSSLLKEGVTLEAASAEVNALGAQLRGSRQEAGRPPRFEVWRELEQMVGAVRPALRVLVVAVVAVMLIVCANVAGLLLVRGSARHREIGIRRALGASRSRIVRQLLTEGLVLSLAGGGGGVVLAYAGMYLVRTGSVIDIPDRFRNALGPLGPTILPRASEISLDPGIIVFAIGLSLLTGIVFGLAPALHLSRADHRHTANASELGARGSNGANRVGQLLAFAQIAVATTLLIGSGLLLHSFVNLSTVFLGFDPSTPIFQLVSPREYSRARKMTLGYDLSARLRSWPGVETAGFINNPPLLPSGMRGGLYLPADWETQRESLGDEYRTQVFGIGPDYLRALGARLLEGRWLDERDGVLHPRTMLVNRAWVDRFSPGKSPIGVNVVFVTSGRVRRAIAWEVVGVIENIRWRLDSSSESWTGADLPLLGFMDLRQLFAASSSGRAAEEPNMELDMFIGEPGGLGFAVRARGGPLTLADLRAAAREIDPAVAVEGVATMGQVFSALIGRQRFYAVVAGLFGNIAGVIAAVGIYGVLTYAMSRRTQEFGIRMALGAKRGDVFALVLRQGIVLTGCGIGVGVAGAGALTRYLTGMLFGLTALDPLTFAVVAVVFAAVALLASYLPARRATKVDPLIALRYE